MSKLILKCDKCKEFVFGYSTDANKECPNNDCDGKLHYNNIVYIGRIKKKKCQN